MAFSAQWLALREPADQLARDQSILRQAAEAAGSDPVILDIGSGTGSTVRAMRPHLPRDTRWRLVDYDSELLATAAAEVGEGSSVQLVDISAIDQLPLDHVTLVTASALLDLVSESWLRSFASRLRVPFYAALTYNGQMEWSPSDSTDAGIVQAFNDHQHMDKGFGSALGPDAAATTRAIFDELGWTVLHAPSPWTLGVGQGKLQRELVTGIARAAAEAGHTEASSWGVRRADNAERATCVVGHEDVLVLPPQSGR